MLKREKMLGGLSVLLAASFYGFMSPIVKGAYGEGHSFAQVTFSQFFYASFFFLPYFLWQLKKTKVNLKELWKLLLVGFLGLGGTSLFYYGSLQLLPASISLILLFQFVWVGLLLEWLFFGHKPTPYHLLSVGVVLLGTFFTIPIGDVGENLSLPGIGLGLAAAFSYSFFLIGTARLSAGMKGGMRSAIMVLGTLVLIFLFFLTYTPPVELNPFGTISKWGLLLGLLGQVFPPLLFSYGAPRIGGSLTSLFGTMELPVGILAAFFILNEVILPIQWFGIGLILAGILFSQLEPLFHQMLKGKKNSNEERVGRKPRESGS